MTFDTHKNWFWITKTMRRKHLFIWYSMFKPFDALKLHTHNSDNRIDRKNDSMFGNKHLELHFIQLSDRRSFRAAITPSTVVAYGHVFIGSLYLLKLGKSKSRAKRGQWRKYVLQINAFEMQAKSNASAVIDWTQTMRNELFETRAKQQRNLFGFSRAKLSFTTNFPLEWEAIKFPVNVGIIGWEA